MKANTDTFLERMSPDFAWSSCRGCGSFQREEDLDDITIDELERFRCSPEFTSFYNGLCSNGQSVHHVAKVRVAHEATALYHFTPTYEGSSIAVEQNCAVCLCGKCRENDPLKITKMRHVRYIDHDIGIPHHQNPVVTCPTGEKLGRLSILNELALARVLTCINIVKLYTSGVSPQQAGYGVRNHVFCVPADGPDKFAEHLASDQWCPSLDGVEHARDIHLVNPGCLETLVIYFFGDGTALRALKSNGMIAAIQIDVAASARHLKYIVDAGKNESYLGLRGKMPTTHADLANILEQPLLALQERALLNIQSCDSAVTAVVESSLPDKGDGYSILTRDPTTVESIDQDLEQIYDLAAESNDKATSLNASVGNQFMNDITEAHAIYSGAFYRHFPLGVPSSQAQPFPQWRVSDLLKSDNPEIEADHRFMGYVSGVIRRRQANGLAKFQFKNDKHAAAEFVKMASAPSFLTEIRRHLSRPSSDDASAFLKKVRPLLSRTQPRLNWSPSEKRNFMPKLFAMVRR